MKAKTICVSTKCNNNCLICCLGKSFLFNRVIKFKDIISRIASDRRKIDSIYLSGGEPTLNEDLFQAIRYIREKYHNIEIALLSNARLFSYESYFKKFLNLNEKKNIKVCISIHGHTARLHDTITRVRGSFLQTLCGIRNLLSYNIPVELRIVVNKINYIYLTDIARFIAHSYILKEVMYIVFIAMDIEGNALKNKDKIVVKYSEFIPSLENALGILQRHGLKIRLYHFPLCIINSKYWPYAWKSLESSKVLFLKECRSCNYKKYCVGILKSYIKNVGKDEFGKIFPWLIIKSSHNNSNPISDAHNHKIANSVDSFFSGKYGVFSSSLPDIIAVRHGIKPLARLSCDSLDIYYEYKHILEEDGIYTAPSKYKIISLREFNPYLFLRKPLKSNLNAEKISLSTSDDKRKGKIYIYFSKDKDLTKRFKSEDPETKLEKPNVKEIEEFAKALGYPSCCIRRHIDLSQKDLVKIYLGDDQKVYYLNNLLHSASNYYLSFHAPCSYDCLRSIEYNKKILEAIGKEFPGFKEKLESILKLPILAWFNSHSVNRFYDDRIMILFEGICNGKFITYNKLFYLKTYYHVSPNNLSLFDLDILRKGNKMEIQKNRLNIYYDKRFINSIKRKSIFEGSLFNFI